MRWPCSGCDVAEHGRRRACQAFELGGPGAAEGTTANSLAAGCRRLQDGQAAKMKLLTRSFSLGIPVPNSTSISYRTAGEPGQQTSES